MSTPLASIIIEQKLVNLGVNINKLTKKQLEHLIKIETLINEQMERQEKALTELNQLGFSINSVSDNTEISRQTFYNNPVLKLYVEHSMSLFNEKNLYYKIKELNDNTCEILEENTKMKYRDLDIESLKHDLNDLKTALKQKEREIAQLK